MHISKAEVLVSTIRVLLLLMLSFKHCLNKCQGLFWWIVFALGSQCVVTSLSSNTLFASRSAYYQLRCIKCDVSCIAIFLGQITVIIWKKWKTVAKALRPDIRRRTTEMPTVARLLLYSTEFKFPMMMRLELVTRSTFTLLSGPHGVYLVLTVVFHQPTDNSSYSFVEIVCAAFQLELFRGP